MLKPAHGSEEDGIFIFAGRFRNMYRRADDLLIPQEELKYYVSNIPSGMYNSLGYQGVDIVLDKDQGPLILEINARPGLNIQIANCTGLFPRLKLIEQHYGKLSGIEERVAFAKDNFAA